MYANETYNLTAEIIPENTTFKDVIWTSSDDSILPISRTGVCSAKTPGEVQIIVMSEDKSCKETKAIHIYSHTTGVSLSESSIAMNVGETQSLRASTLPLETSDGLIEWSTNNDKIASVDNNGVVTAKGRGTCTITATSVDGGYTAECIVTVMQPVEVLTLEKHTITLKNGETEKMFAQITPETADNKSVVWTSTNEEVAKVDENGNVKALKAGETWIKAVSVDNEEAKDSCKVIVLQSVTGIMLDHSTYQLNAIGESFGLQATIEPSDASNQNIKWSSSNESVCIVSRGTVIAVGFGTSVIIANTEDGGYVATCIVTVVDGSDVASVKSEDESIQI